MRIGERRLLELVQKYGRATFQSAIRHFMDYGEQVSLKALECSQGRFELAEEQDDGAVFKVAIEITDKTFVVDLTEIRTRFRPDQCQSRRRHHLRQNGLQGVQRRGGPANGGSSAAAGHHPARNDFRSPGAGGDGLLFEVEVRVFDLMLRCLAPHMPNLLPAGGFPRSAAL